MVPVAGVPSGPDVEASRSDAVDGVLRDVPRGVSLQFVDLQLYGRQRICADARGVVGDDTLSESIDSTGVSP